MIEIGAAVEDYILHAGFLCPSGDQFSNSGGRHRVGAGFSRLAQLLVEGRRCSQGPALGVVDNLRIDVLGRAEDAQPRTTTRSQGNAVLPGGRSYSPGR